MKFIFALTILPTLLFADTTNDDPLACVDPLIAAAFLSGFGTTSVPEISRDVPPQLSDLRFPEGLEYLGSSVSNRSTQVAFRSDLAPKKAEDLAIKLLESGGWAKVTGNNYTATGFQTAPDGMSMCHDDRGTVAISTRMFGRDSIVKMFLSGSSELEKRSCGEDDQRAKLLLSPTHSILPKLELPPGGVSKGSGSGSGGNGRIMEATSHVDIEVSMTSEELSGFFGTQIEGQDWVFDSDWSGRLATGSVWSKAIDNTPYVGFLTVINGKPNNFNVSFSVRTLVR